MPPIQLVTLCRFAGLCQQKLQKLQGNDLVFQPLPSAPEGNGGYSCLAGEGLRKENLGKSGAIFLQTAASGGLHPNSPQHPTFVTPLLRVSQAGQRRDHPIIRKKTISRRGLDNPWEFRPI